MKKEEMWNFLAQSYYMLSSNHNKSNTKTPVTSKDPSANPFTMVQSHQDREQILIKLIQDILKRFPDFLPVESQSSSIMPQVIYNIVYLLYISCI